MLAIVILFVIVVLVTPLGVLLINLASGTLSRNRVKDIISTRNELREQQDAIEVAPESEAPLRDEGFELRAIPLQNAATICLRRYPRRGVVRGALLIFGKLPKGFPSIYDLGNVNSDRFAPELLQHFTDLGKRQILKLSRAGQIRRKEGVPTLSQRVRELPPIPYVDPVEDEAETARELEEAGNKVFRFRPSSKVYRGELIYMGEMPKDSNGKRVLVHGVKLKTEDGKEECCYGIDLKEAVRKAHVGLGDLVEVVKVGSRIISEGKAPMNIWNISRVS